MASKKGSGDMAKRSVCLCDGEYIGIESIYTVINGNQVNIREKLLALREKSNAGKLRCPCGCGAILTLVAGDRNLRKQHFRLKHGSNINECHMVTEGKVSVDSKIVLKCWMDDNLKVDDVKTRVPISHIEDTNRKYEFSLLSQSKKVAISYNHDRVNLSDEKLSILESNSDGIKIIYIVDVMNSGNYGQYPEALMKIQDRQMYCLFLDIDDRMYDETQMSAAFYIKNNDGLWEEVKFVSGKLSDYTLNDNRELLYQDELLSELLQNRYTDFEESLKEEREWREAERKRREEEEQRLKAEAEQREIELKKHREEAERKRREQQEAERKRREQEEAERRAEAKHRDKDFKRNVAENFTQQERQVIDAYGNRWIKCEHCGKQGMVNEFSSYGGKDHINLGICKECSKKVSVENVVVIKKPVQARQNMRSCPVCGGTLKEKTGRFGEFFGCSNYPKCTYTRKK